MCIITSRGHLQLHHQLQGSKCSKFGNVETVRLVNALSICLDSLPTQCPPQLDPLSQGKLSLARRRLFIAVLVGRIRCLHLGSEPRESSTKLHFFLEITSFFMYFLYLTSPICDIMQK